MHLIDRFLFDTQWTENVKTLKVRICVGQYPTQLTVTLQNCRKIWSSIFVVALVAQCIK